MIVVDTSFVYALLDVRDQHHSEAAQWYDGTREELATTPLVLAEVDHLAGARAGAAARAAFRRDVAAGAFAVDWWREAPGDVVGVAERYEDIGIDLTDASLVALADRLETDRVATFDERHFRALRPSSGRRAFTLLPIDV